MQLWEFHESEWFPPSFRNAITEILRVLDSRLRVHHIILPVLERVLAESGTDRIVDLCSGAGGPVLLLREELAARNRRVSVVLTDKFPNLAAFRIAEEGTEGAVVGHSEAIDATQVPPELTGVRTLFNAFHHFPPDAARALLAGAFHSRQSLAIFETTERTLWNTLTNFPLSFLSMVVLMPAMRAKRREWWLFTYLLPLLPAAFGWDAFVSCLRSYTASEFQELTQGLQDESYGWCSGRIRVPRSSIHVSYYLGIPVGNR